MTNEQTPTGTNSDSGQLAQARQRLASDPKTDPIILDKLSQTYTSEILERVAENPQTNPEILEKLSADNSAEVRSAVAENANTPDIVIESLAFDQHPDVRFRLAENPHSPVEILENLVGDENPYVAARAQETLNSLKSLLEKADEHLVKEQFVEAEKLYKQLATKLTTLLGGQHIEVAQTLHKLAAAVNGQGKSDEALAFEKQAKAIQSAQGGM